tara:strand:+ start:173 stop:367 length:195 start_codon:yes stop_codon:yes gene_type:complete
VKKPNRSGRRRSSAESLKAVFGQSRRKAFQNGDFLTHHAAQQASKDWIKNVSVDQFVGHSVEMD